MLKGRTLVEFALKLFTQLPTNAADQNVLKEIFRIPKSTKIFLVRPGEASLTMYNHSVK
jgi:hypothetical protein